MVKAKERRSTDYFRSCQGKIKYASLEEARLKAEDYNLNRRVLTFGDFIITAYPCSFCRRNHIGHRRVYA